MTWWIIVPIVALLFGYAWEIEREKKPKREPKPTYASPFAAGMGLGALGIFGSPQIGAGLLGGLGAGVAAQQSAMQQQHLAAQAHDRQSELLRQGMRAKGCELGDALETS